MNFVFVAGGCDQLDDSKINSFRAAAAPRTPLRTSAPPTYSASKEARPPVRLSLWGMFMTGALQQQYEAG